MGRASSFGLSRSPTIQGNSAKWNLMGDFLFVFKKYMSLWAYLAPSFDPSRSLNVKILPNETIFHDFPDTFICAYTPSDRRIGEAIRDKRSQSATVSPFKWHKHLYYELEDILHIPSWDSHHYGQQNQTPPTRYMTWAKTTSYWYRRREGGW